MKIDFMKDCKIVKLKNIATHKTEKNKNLKYKITYTNSATQGIIKQTDYFDKKISNDENIAEYYIIERNDYIYNPRISVFAPCGPINKSHLEETGIMSPLYTVFRLNDEYKNNDYIEHYFKSSLWHGYMRSVANYGARHDRMNITNNDFFNMPIPLPSLEIQQKIAEILSTQDKVIELKQKLVDQKKQQKKWLMQNLLTGKIRLKGFEGEWEKARLSDFLYVNKEKNTELKYDKTDVFSISGEYGIVNQMNFLGRSYAGKSVESYRIVYPDNIVYTKSPLKKNPYGIIKSNKTDSTGIVSTLYAVYFCKDNVISRYVEYYFSLDSTVNNYLVPLVNIGTKHDMKISDENVLTGLVTFPPIEEQEKIAEILSAQDKEIELLEKQLEQEKLKKKALMQLLLTVK